MKNHGQYNGEYIKCPCFWGTDPAKYVKLIPKYITSGKALDLGAGEGKNSFYLASLGFDVTAVEISPYAVKNFIDRLISEEEKSGKDITNKMQIVLGDMSKWQPSQNYDVIVSYGSLHCLASKKIVEDVVHKSKKATKNGGINVVCTFTNDLPVPDIQKYLTPTLLTGKEVKDLYSDWKILEYEVGTTEHSHPTSKTFHKHSVCRLIAKKI